jgi:hypothetical protein
MLLSFQAQIVVTLLRTCLLGGKYSEHLKLFPVLMPLWPDGLQRWFSSRVM